jgi:hypothetical protein
VEPVVWCNIVLAMTAQELKAKRIINGIPAQLVAPRARVSGSRLSDIERGYASAAEDELARISSALDQLIAARTELRAVAERVGWPAESI